MNDMFPGRVIKMATALSAMLVVLAWPRGAPGALAAPERAETAEGTTVVAELLLTPEALNQDEIRLSALVAGPPSGPADPGTWVGLALRWQRRDLGWTKVWELQLAHRRDARDEVAVVQLSPVAPAAGTRYRATLSYDPEGEVAVALRNVSRGEDIVATTFRVPLLGLGLTAPPPSPGAEDGDDAGPGVDVIAFERLPGYQSVGLPLALQREFHWRIVRGPQDAPLDGELVLFANDTAGLQLMWPREPVSGFLRLSAVIGASQLMELLTAEWRPGSQVVPWRAEIPPGRFRLRLEYVGRSHVQTIAEMEGLMMPWDRIPPVDAATLNPDLFVDEELFVSYAPNVVEPAMPYYLMHFNRVANAVQPDGFIDLAVWRNAGDQGRYNARVMENILSLAYFYTANEPWNPYYNSEPLRARLEAALSFWVGIQSEDGRFSEYGDRMWNLAATGFATKFMGETLRLLHAGPPVDASLLGRVAGAMRKAIVVILTDQGFYEQGRRFTNQFGNVWPGALAYLTLFDDSEIEALLHERLADAARDFQSPAGYYYEADSVDWSYNFGTHRSNTRMAWHYLQSGRLNPSLVRAFERFFIDGERLWFEWLSYNAVREPDGSLFLLNRAIESRGSVAAVERVDTELIDFIPVAAAFATSEEEREAAVGRERTNVERNWPWVKPLQVGDFRAFPPYRFLHIENTQRHPSAGERDRALTLLPYLASERFTHQRSDARRPLVITYVRRPTYYAAFNAGAPQRTQQRLGLGVLWNPDMGALLQSQTSSDVAAWGTRAVRDGAVYEKDISGAVYVVSGERWQPRPGSGELPGGDVRIDYPLGASGGAKTVLFGEQGIEVRVQHPGDFYEFIPLLVASGDSLEVGPGRVALIREGRTFEIRAEGNSEPVEIVRLPAQGTVGRYAIVPVRFTGKDALRYDMRVLD